MILDLTTYNNVYICGDIHGNFIPFNFEVHIKKKLQNSVIIVCGDIGMGFHKPNYYINTFIRLNKNLNQNNNVLILFRGNHDNDEYFNNIESVCPELLKYENIKLVPDYSVLKTSKGNILCIGGARSIDKTQRHLNISYWQNEMVKKLEYDFEIDDIFLNNKISYICSHTAPLEAKPHIILESQGKFVEDWAIWDSTLKKDNYDERQYLSDKILHNQYNIHLKSWIYGHYHTHNEIEFDNVNFIGLDMFREHNNKSDWYTI